MCKQYAFFSTAWALLGFCATLAAPSGATANAEWAVVFGAGNRDDVALSVAFDDLKEAGDSQGLQIRRAAADDVPEGNCILVGNAARNVATEQVIADGIVQLLGVDDPQGFEIRTGKTDMGTVMVVSGGAIEGDVYGLYWLWDRLRVFKTLPDLNVKRVPAFSIRSGGARDEVSMRRDLRYTVNWVSGADSNDLVPWDSEPLRSDSARQRISVKKHIDYAHALHMKFFTYADEFSYDPGMLAEFGATLSPADPKLWDLLQEKYRRLLTALPDIDGIRIRTGELTRVVEPLKPYDVMHEPEDPEWPLDRRYRTFLQKLHEVVVGEFDKLYYHRTWVTNTTEQHSRPEVYTAIFTEAVPTKNLFLSPYLTTGDRWFYQPINPTFNLTPHKMLVLLASMNYHEDGNTNLFPTYTGLYFQEGFEKLWRNQESNIVGSQFGSATRDGWWSNDLTAYTAYRISWDPLEDPRVIAEDFASTQFGRKTAKTMGEVIMLSGEAYKHGLYIKPVAEAISGNTLAQLRLTTFVIKGFPEIDRGKAHIQWLHDALYMPSVARRAEAIEYLDKGLELSERMRELGKEARPDFDDPGVAKQVMESLDLAHLLILTNNAYVKTCFAYFDYRNEPSEARKEQLAAAANQLDNAVAAFRKAPGFTYKLYGVVQLLRNAREALQDISEAERRLAAAPDEDELAELVVAHQDLNRELFAAHGRDALKVLHWKGMVDGKDIVRICRDTLEIEHVAADPIHSDEATFFAPLPERPGTVFLRDIRSGEIHPFVLTQPSAANDYTVEVYLFDPGPGYALWEFELYYLDQLPEALGVNVSWEK